MCILFQRLKLSSQTILLIGVSVTVAAYLLLTDWQTIPYDPCTEYSPFHHPEIIKNQSRNITSESATNSNSPEVFKINLQTELLLQFESGAILHSSGIVSSSATCNLNSSCPSCDPTIPLHHETQGIYHFEK